MYDVSNINKGEDRWEGVSNRTVGSLMSKRTIDYYTNLGILKAERSQSNYRYYDETAFETLQFIEVQKMHMPLCEIKENRGEEEAARYQ